MKSPQVIDFSYFLVHEVARSAENVSLNPSKNRFREVLKEMFDFKPSVRVDPDPRSYLIVHYFRLGLSCFLVIDS